MALLNLGGAVAVGFVEDAAVRRAWPDSLLQAHVNLVLHDAIGNARIAHLQALVRTPVPAVPLADAEQRAAWESALRAVRHDCLGSVRLGPEPHRERLAAAPVESAVDTPAGRDGKGLEDMLVLVP
ncbi:hypothetical protein D9M68_887040 [compost metagenome]